MPDQRPLLGDPRLGAQEELAFKVVDARRCLTRGVLGECVEDVFVTVQLVHSHTGVDRVGVLLVGNNRQKICNGQGEFRSTLNFYGTRFTLYSNCLGARISISGSMPTHWHLCLW